MDILKRRENENPQQYLWRIGKLKDSGIITNTWEEITPVLNEQTGADRRFEAWRKEYSTAKKYKENVFNVDVKFESELKADVMKKQAQTVNLETNKWLREHARDELILEEIKECVKGLEPYQPHPPISKPKSDKIGILLFGDEHFGTEFTIYGLANEVINHYDDKVFYDRMWRLFYEVVRLVEEKSLTDLYVFEMGDFADGVLRTSQLLKLQFGVVESTVRYAEFISGWLDKLSQRVRVHFQMTPGNHTELRMLGQPKGSFKDENMDIVVRAFVKARLADNPNFEITENKTGYIYEDIFGYKILGVHGEVSGTSAAIKDLAMAYGKSINYLCAGHKHHKLAEEAGRDVEFIGVPSIIGVDPYAMSLNCTSNPAATFLTFEKGYGLKSQDYIKLG